jgi:Ca2+-binding EF-hand superfamily protein
MLSKETEQKLVEIFITLSIGEEKINKLKQNILSNYNINPIQIFFKLDLNNVGYLSKSDFFPFLKFFSINFSPVDIDYIFFFYDKDEDNILCFNEFLDLIISDSNYFYKKSFMKKFRKKKFTLEELNEDCGQSIEKKILEILLEEIELSKQLIDLIINIKQCQDFIIQNVFYEIKSYSYITNDSLKAFFDRNEVDYNDKFVKNIFSRLNNKDTVGKISFNKFKKFFDLPFNKNIMRQSTKFIDNQFQPNFSQTCASSDIKFNCTENNKYMQSNIPNQNFIPPCNNNYKYNNIRNENYINEEDIQFKCNHLSRSGSIESYNNELDKSNNCKYLPKHAKRNNLYKNYLREKRSKSLEKSLTKSICSSKNIFSKTEKRDIIDKNIRNIRMIRDDEYNSLNLDNNFNNSGGSFHEDLPVKLPIRLDKNLVRRQLAKRNNHQYNKFNCGYNGHFDDLNMNKKIGIEKENDLYHSNHYISHNKMLNRNKEIELNNGFNNLDLKIYQEDMSSQINNGKY